MNLAFLDLAKDWIAKRRPDRPVAGTDEPESPIYVIAGQPVRFLSQAAIMTAEAAQRRNPQLYRVTNFVASSVQSVPWYCEPDPDVVATERAGASVCKAINDLLRSPNDQMTAQSFLYWIALNLMLYGRSHFKVGVSSSGQPNGLYPLAARYTKGILNNRGTVDYYEYGETEPGKTTLPTRRTAAKLPGNPAYAAEISFPTLTGLVEYNKAPAAIECIAIPLAIIQALMQRALDTAMGHPNVRYVITAEKTITKAQRDALTKYLEDSGPGEENSGNVLFLYNTDIKVHQLDNNLGDIHSKLPLDDMTRQVAGVFGVPIALLGLGSADAAKYANNYQESRLAFWQDTVMPTYLAPISAGMSAAICPPGCRICFDYDAIPAMWAGRSKLGESLSDVAFLTTNEKREILGYPADDSLPKLIAGPRMSVTPMAPAPDGTDTVKPSAEDVGATPDHMVDPGGEAMPMKKNIVPFPA